MLRAVNRVARRPIPRFAVVAGVLLAGLFASPSLHAAGATAPQATQTPPPPHRVFEAHVPEFDTAHYTTAVEALFSSYEQSGNRKLVPGKHAKVALKVYSDSGPGLSTRPPLVRAVVAALEKRGFARDKIVLVGLNAAHLRDCGFLPPLSRGGDTFEGSPVLDLESGRYYESGWYYDSPLPSHVDSPRPGGSDETDQKASVATDAERKSFLPMPLLFDVDFWINLPACTDHPVVGVNAALANITLWNASNTTRFFRSPATAPAAVAEMAAIPELRAGFAFTMISLERYQFIGGPIFNSLYTLSEPLVWLSEDPVAIDALMRDRINAGRRAAGFRDMPADTRLVSYAEQLGLGSGNIPLTEWVRVSGGSDASR